MGLNNSTLPKSPVSGPRSNESDFTSEQASCLKIDALDDEQLPSWKRMTHKPISVAEAEESLRQHEDVVSWKLPGLACSACTHSVRVPSLSPVEDDLAYGEINVGSIVKWSYWGVYDGHS